MPNASETQPNYRSSQQENAAVAVREKRITSLTDMLTTPKRGSVAPTMIAMFARQYELVAAVEASTGDVRTERTAEAEDYAGWVLRTIQNTDGYNRVQARGIQMQVRDLAATFPPDGAISQATSTAIELKKIIEDQTKKGNTEVILAAQIAGLTAPVKQSPATR